MRHCFPIILYNRQLLVLYYTTQKNALSQLGQNFNNFTHNTPKHIRMIRYAGKKSHVSTSAPQSKSKYVQIYKTLWILPLSIQFLVNPLPCEKVVCILCLIQYTPPLVMEDHCIDSLLISSSIFKGKRKYSACDLKCTFCVLLCGAEVVSFVVITGNHVVLIQTSSKRVGIKTLYLILSKIDYAITEYRLIVYFKPMKFRIVHDFDFSVLG